MTKKNIEITGTHNRRQIRLCNDESFVPIERKFYSQITTKFTQDDIKKIIPELYLKIDDDKVDFSLLSLTEIEKSIISEIKVKLSSYINQDKTKKKLNCGEKGEKISLHNILEKMLTSKHKCYYCKNTYEILYEYTREPKQWTLERINNDLGHTNENCVVSCLECNLKRRTTDIKKFEFTKNLKITKKE